MISILLPNLAGGGAERVNIDLAYEFARAGHDVEFVLMQAKGPLLEEVRSVFPIVDLGTPRVRSLPIALLRYLRKRKPEALLASMWPLTAIAPFSARLAGHSCRVVIAEHGILSAQYSDWGRFHRAMLKLSTGLGYRLARYRVGVSSGVVADIAGLSGMSFNDFHVVHNPVPPRPTPAPAAVEAAEALWAAPPGARILSVGTMKAVKNHPLLLQAFARLDRPGERLMFVGDGAKRDELLSLARELGVADRVVLAGFHSDPTPFYMTADLFALASDYEGFGNVLVEALASGTPIVSTDCPSGPSEILDGGRYGRLVPVRDVEAMAEALDTSLDQPFDPDHLIERAQDFAPAVAAEAYIHLLTDAKSAKRKRGTI
jgi:glycosyltransferase involved in cell wall biosynthesis